MLRTLTLAALLAGAAVACAQAPPGNAPAKAGVAAPPPLPGQPPVIRLAHGAKPARALEYRLLPGPDDRVPGNAAPLWLRAGMAIHGARHKMTDAEYDWASSDKVPLKALPRKEVREFLKHYEAGLRLADQAARRDRCDWGRPPLTIQTLNDLPLEEIQYLRHLTAILSIRCRLELAEGRFDQALRSLQTGFALGRDLSGKGLLIQDLVGIAIGTITIGRVDEWVQIPHSPNLYWSLTALPRPLFDVRPSMEEELGTIYRSFPQLRQARQGTLTAKQAEAVLDECVGCVGKTLGNDVPAWAAKLSAATLALKYYPDAKKYLLAHGRKAAEVDAMPAVQAVLLYFMAQYDEACDDIVKWLNLPPWQAQAGLERVERRLRDLPSDGAGVALKLLLPALSKTYAAQVRTERYVAGLRGAEALRLYAAAHGGKPPAKWADITEVPLPTDPLTGKGLDALYRLQPDGKGVLDLLPPPPMPALIGRRYELSPPG
jgi:tetratricopeptide (TPR) repeat protein